MSIPRLICVFVFFASLLCANLYVLGQSNKGTEFWTAYMAHINGTASRMSLYISADAATDFKVELADGTVVLAESIAANTVKTVDIPSLAYLGNTEYSGGPGNKKGIHITSTLPVAVYAHIYDRNVSGATLLLPVNSLNKDYYSINFTQRSNQEPAFSTFAIIATEDGTRVQIIPSANIVERTGNTNVTKYQAGQLYEILLNKGDVYQGTSPNDLTGTRILSVASATGDCKKIAVFSGSSKIRIGESTNGSSDNLFQQVYPTAVWGKNFIAAPLKGRAYDIVRVIYSDPTANVTINGSPVTPTSTAGSIAYYQFNNLNQDNVNAVKVIKSDKPIQVVQYAVTQNNGINAAGAPIAVIEAAGDPEMIYLPPVEQGLRRITLYSPSAFAITANYINIIIPTAAKSSFTLDGVSRGSDFTDIPNSVYSYAQIGVSSGQHTINAAESFNAIAYGFGQAESYGYAAGTNLLNLNEFITLNGLASSSSQLLGCTGVPYYLQLTVPYQPTKILWNPADGSAPVTQNNPAFFKNEALPDGTVLYTYRFVRAVTYPTGNFTASATVTLPLVTSTDCGSEKIVDFNFNIANYPVANFTPPVNNCAGSTLQFTDESDAAGSIITSWQWDFGDGFATTGNPNTSILPSPQHTYTRGGDYTVKLTVVNENGCESPTITKVVHINKNPTVAFQFTSPDCQGKEVTFTDLSAPNEGNITEWKWTFDDGTTEIKTTAAPFTHTFTDLRDYNITLQITTDKGCTNTLTKVVSVHALPLVSFNLPDACIQNAATFTSTSTISDGTEAGFTYQWDFGDPNATAANPNVVSGKQVSHRYTQVRGIDNPYKVKLKVTSLYGCVTELTQDFVVNGSQPKAVIKFPAQICSTDNLVIESESYVADVGNITKYIVYYDYDGDKTNMEIYDKDHLPIPADKKFLHQYPMFNTPATKTYRIYVEVYSGGDDCRDVYTNTVTVNANPLITLTHAADICQESLPTQFGENKTIYTGTGVFTGPGVSPAGEFNPKAAGPGPHEITYTFTTDGTSCTYQEKFSIVVYPTPVITGKRDITVNLGEQVTIDPLVVSLNRSPLTYVWTPRLGLNQNNIMSPIASPAADTKYLLTVTSGNGCVAYAYFNINVIASPVIFNTFTPNGDGNNDFWKIPNMEAYPKATVEVFNRNGSKVFNSVGYPVPWDGRYNGSDLPAATYYYIINLKNGKPVLSGPVTIIR
ncbi:PKD domain-containing protein [Mucilaginibacter sp. PAMB04274]|uniref:PKD domain-containing protein n=1 Tax=Mucilaginibacter sp. PAMB04274 TaxID=3138568 RepID=UPI003327F32E